MRLSSSLLRNSRLYIPLRTTRYNITIRAPRRQFWLYRKISVRPVATTSVAAPGAPASIVITTSEQTEQEEQEQEQQQEEQQPSQASPVARRML